MAILCNHFASFAMMKTDSENSSSSNDNEESTEVETESEEEEESSTSKATSVSSDESSSETESELSDSFKSGSIDKRACNLSGSEQHSEEITETPVFG